MKVEKGTKGKGGKGIIKYARERNGGPVTEDTGINGELVNDNSGFGLHTVSLFIL